MAPQKQPLRQAAGKSPHQYAAAGKTLMNPERLVARWQSEMSIKTRSSSVGKMRGFQMPTTRVIHSHEFGKIKAFYQENGYSQSLDPTDKILVAEDGGEICAALRLCHEHGYLVLRGMRVSPEFQRQGIGSQLLRFALEGIQNEVCFCIPHSHLRDFYAQIGFEQISPEKAPAYLASRLDRYRRKYGLDVILMRKPVG
jgi:predicted N-acetyltransferase YhbS